MRHKFSLMRHASLGLLAGTLLAGCVVYPAHPYGPGPGYADNGVVVQESAVVGVAPPEPLYEDYGVAPGADFVWVGGFWDWEGGRYVWHRGSWQHGRPGYGWSAPHWNHVNGGWKRSPGRWVAHGGYRR